MLLLPIPLLILSGWLLGSLVNYIADVLPHTRRLGPLACPSCGRTRTLAEHLLMKPCPQCGARRSRRAWVVQILAVAILLATWFYPGRMGFWLGALALTYFGVVAVIDIEHRLILYVESAVGALLGLGIGLSLHGLVQTLIGGVAGLLIMAGLFLLGAGLAKLFGRLRGQPIEEDALGFSDILLCANLGLIVGWPGVAALVFYTIFIAGAGSLVILLSQLARRNYQPFAPVAFGPYLLIAAVLLLYWPK